MKSYPWEPKDPSNAGEEFQYLAQAIQGNGSGGRSSLAFGIRRWSFVDKASEEATLRLVAPWFADHPEWEPNGTAIKRLKELDLPCSVHKKEEEKQLYTLKVRDAESRVTLSMKHLPYKGSVEWIAE